MEEQEVKLPRPLQAGEVYCHLCQTFFKLAEHDEHRKLCRIRAIGKAKA